MSIATAFEVLKDGPKADGSRYQCPSRIHLRLPDGFHAIGVPVIGSA
jgi:hypothetical protein